jgi:proton-coupled amino acid transporter
MFEQQEGEGGDDTDTAERKTLVAAFVDHKASSSSNAVVDGITEWEAGVSLAKAIMGAGSFALPWAFLQMGYLAGPLFLAILMALSVYSLQLLVTCARASGQHSYVDVADCIFGRTGAIAAYAASVSASLGVCGSYLVFIAANLQSLFVSSNEGEAIQEAPPLQTEFILLVLPIAILLSAARDMKRFAFASLLGDISVVLGMVVVLVYGVWHHEGTAASKGVVAIGSLETMPLAFGAIGYLFLVHFLSLPIESAMIRPERFHRVSIITFSTCAVLSGGFGVLGYLLFGSETQQIVLLNVQGSYFVSAVKLLLCVDLLLTYPVVMRPSIVIVEQSLGESSSSLTTSSKTKKRTTTDPSVVGWTTHLAVCLVLGLVAAAGGIFVPAFGLLSGLVGGVSQTFLAFVLPPLMLSKQRHQARMGRENGSSSFGVASLRTNKELGLVVLGVILIVWTLVTTWRELYGVDEH